jgi:hypothetical protein
MNNPNLRFNHHLDDFNSKFKKSFTVYEKNNLSPIGHNLYEVGARTPLFQLQGLARIEKKVGKNKDAAEQWLLQLKDLEDGIGKYDYWRVMMANNKRWKFPKEIQNYFEFQAAYELGVLEERLSKYGWIEKDYTGVKLAGIGYNKLAKSFKKGDWYSSEKEKRKLASLFMNESIEIHDKIDKKELDLNNVELGIHEFRRNVRWIGIYSSALLGKARIEKYHYSQPLKKFVSSEKEKISFNKLPINAKQKDPLYILPGAFYAMSDLIFKIGEIKDLGLATEEMTKIGKMYNLSTATIKKHLGNEYCTHSKVVSEAKKLINDYVLNENLFKHMAEHFYKQTK